MKLRHLILIVIVIVLAHAAVVFFCLRGGSSSSGGSRTETSRNSGNAATHVGTMPRQDTRTTYSASSAAQGKAVSSHGQGKRVPVQPESSGMVSAQKPRLRIEKKFPSLTYTYSWNGNIPELPRSKGARAGILVDADTGRVLWNKNATTAFQIASMTKIMTNLLAYEDIISGRGSVTMQTPVKVTLAAQKIGGSQVWLDTRETFPLEELLKAVSIKSANDAAYLVAEFLGGGSVSAFVARMNQRARQLGMYKTRFFNAHGLPGKSSRTDNMSSPQDMVILAQESLKYPQLMRWAGTVRTHFRKPGTRGHISIVNHNNLLPGGKYPAPGVDGLKTGVITRSGYCVTATCLRNGHRMIAVVMGYNSAKNRDFFVRQLLNWGYERRANPAKGLAETRKKAEELRNRRPVPTRRRARQRRS